MNNAIEDENVSETTVTRSSGNVFADLGLPDPEERMAKAKLALAITRRIRALDLTQDAAAKMLGTDQGKVSAIARGRLAGFTYDRLLRFLNILGCNVTIAVEAPPERAEATSPIRRGHVAAVSA